jgi:tetratricopeptide (TPR) repeat protein
MNERVVPPSVQEPAPTSAGALDLAMAAEAHDPQPNSPARTVLLEQARLLREQVALARNERFRNRIKAARDASLALLALALVGAGGWAVWDASRARGVVIEPLSTPPALADAGLTGPAAAARLLDQLDAMQTAMEAVSAITRRATAGSGDEVRVVIPSTGVSAGELLRLLRRRLGQETVVTGEVAEAGSGRLSLTVRVDGQGARTFTGPADQIDALFAQAADAIYERADPYKHTIWLTLGPRQAEALPRLRALTYGGSREDRARAWAGMSAVLRQDGRFAEAAAAARRSATIHPELPNSWGNLFEAEALLGRSQGFLEAIDKLSALDIATTVKNGTDPERAPSLAATGQGWARLMRGDTEGAISAFDTAVARAERESDALRPRCLLGTALASAHRESAGLRLARTAMGEAGNRRSAPCRQAEADSLAGLEAWAALAALPPPEFAPWSRPQSLQHERVQVTPLRALAAARLGRVEAARALIATTPADCHLCTRVRAQIAELAGERAEADRLFAEAVRQGPSLPFAAAEWGRARLARGDAEGAIRLFREARKRGPRWADPLKFEGDALAGRGDHRGALRRYAQAAGQAPRWGALHLAWGRSLQVLGRGDEARAKYRQAAGLDLNAADRAEVRRRLAGASA